MLYSRPAKVASPELPENIEKFNKAKDMFSKMSIYFDENFYSDNRNDENCYKYMYLIYHMLACKAHYFNSYNEYDEYAQFATNTIYLRFIKKQAKGERIKSVLNYIKSTLYPLKVMYQNATYKPIPKADDPQNDGTLNEVLKQMVQDQYNDGMEDDIIDSFGNIPLYIDEVISHTPYKYDKVMSRRIKMSCMITLLKGFTLTNDNIKKINDRKSAGNDTLGMTCKMLNKARETSTTTWRLEPSMGNYIQVLSNQVRRKILKEIDSIKSSYVIPDDTIDAILSTAWDGTNHDENNEDDED